MTTEQLEQIFNEILEYQMDNVPLAKTTAVYKLAQKGLSMLTQPPIDNKAVDEWISVEDRLPDVGQEVLCIQEVTETALMAVYTDLGFKVQKYTSPNDRSYVPYWLGVTLWMPLPTPPKNK